ncbi:MAG: carboxypeptidase-like regulatory domain-containing protein [bacterium]|nr:carboxypeptidase-like regulatory domain-containing protein [bacterium]
MGSEGNKGLMWLMLMGVVVMVWIAAGVRENPKDFEFIEDEGWGSWNGVLTGRITDKEGRPIAGARVKVHSKDMETRTDRNGFFTFRGLQQGGRYSLIVEASGYDTALLRWIPIPRTHSADIGDWYLEELTNFWRVVSNEVAAGVWVVSSNMVEIAGSYTGEMTYAEWVSSNVAERALAGAEGMPLISERPGEGEGEGGTVTNETGMIPVESKKEE